MSDSPSVDGSSAQRPITVLLIDDQPIVAESVRRMLAGEPDIVFHYCQNPARAIETANQVQPTVILQDLVMPEIDGLLLVKFLRANKATRDVPMIVLSGKEEPAIKAQAFALGANDYLVKFPDKLEVVARLRYHSRGYIALLERNEAYARGRLVPAGGQCGQRDLGSLAGRYRFPRSGSRRYGEMPTPVGLSHPQFWDGSKKEAVSTARCWGYKSSDQTARLAPSWRNRHVSARSRFLGTHPMLQPASEPGQDPRRPRPLRQARSACPPRQHRPRPACHRCQARHAIKRVWRFCDNSRVVVCDAMAGLLLVLALAYWLLVGVGLLARQHHRPGRWCSSNDQRQCSVLTIGKILLEDMPVSAGQAFAAVLAATIDILGKLGMT